MGFGKFLKGLLRWKWVVILIAALLVAGAFYVYPSIGTEFMPSAATRKFRVDVQMPEGTVLARTSSTMSNVEEISRRRR